MSSSADLSVTTNGAAAEVVIGACLARGLDHFFVAPGSRCTPLTLAIAEQPEARVIQHFDERGLAFACLGYGRATGRPGVFVCTSGTAAANALPAVIEAALDHVPMLLLTADRPPELRDTGANQAIDQLKLFGDYPAWFFELPCPGPGLTVEFWRSCLNHAVTRCADGPVHLNWMFREPFGSPTTWSRSLSSQWEPMVANPQYAFELPPGNTLVMAGACAPAAAQAARGLANRLGCPFLADVTHGPCGLAHDLLLIRDDLPPPQVIVHVGGRVVSKRWWRFVDRHRSATYVHFWPHADRFNPTHRPLQWISGDPAALCNGVIAGSATAAQFTQVWQQAADACFSAARSLIGETVDLTEPGIALAVLEDIHSGHGLFLGNSMPVRDFDLVSADGVGPHCLVAANRGASGIDGLIATACGFAHGLGDSTTAVVGDLSALHDLNSLSLLAASPVPITLVIINNDGGGIFHFLPVAEESPHFERYFATPHGRNFSAASQMFGLTYYGPQDMNEFRECYRAAAIHGDSCVIELRTDRHRNLELHRTLEAVVRGLRL